MCYGCCMSTVALADVVFYLIVSASNDHEYRRNSYAMTFIGDRLFPLFTRQLRFQLLGIQVWHPKNIQICPGKET